MPPKTKSSAPTKKTEQKKKEKIIEDKTFGLKNKKGAKTQKFIQQVQHQVKSSGTKKVDEKKTETTKVDKKKEALELNQLFKPVNQKVEKGTDPKSVLCAFFKQGQCAKGDRCKFSHDLNLERKAEKRSIYVDMRDDDNMDNWDEDKLKEVVAQKHAEADLKLKTEIICKYFVDALEKSKYGWFWECPKGEKCIYRHALPPGFVLNKDKKKEDKVDELSIEDLVEKERINLGSNLTKVTLETFLAWKKRKQKEKKDTNQSEEARKKAEFKAGRSIGLSGREMFTFRPEMAAEDQTEDDEVAFDTSTYAQENKDDSPIHEVILDNIRAQATESSDSTESQKLGEASGGMEVDDASLASPLTPEEVPIDEDLFADDDEDLDELEENLDELELNA
uniref:Zinc finger CCCH domain-containing protein 15 n=1 Tax=Strigamia maritima TaxID=126957 RepID=T1IXC1_STRMM